MTGYVRQSAAEIMPGSEVKAGPINNELNALQTAMSGITGHTHDGTTGSGPKIDLTSSVSGRLPAVNFPQVTNMKLLGNVSGSTADVAEVTLYDEDSMVSDSATGVATQQSTKAYVDNLKTRVETITALKTVALGTSVTALNYLQLQPTDFGTGKPRFYISKSSTSNTWTLGIFDGTNSNGTLNISAQNTVFSGLSTFTGGIAAVTFSGIPTVSINTATTASDYLRLQPTDYGTGKNRLYINKPSGSPTIWDIGITDGTNSNGILRLTAQFVNVIGGLQVNGVAALTSVSNPSISGDWFFIDGFNITDNVDTSKVLKIRANNISTGTTRVVQAPNADGTMYVQGNILGTVSQSSGVPTGAIIERGSNANGEYVRYADGTMICTFSDTTGQAVNTANGNIFISPAVGTWTFPKPFAVMPTTFGSAAASARWVNAVSNTTIATYRTLAGVSSGTLVQVDLVAIGRWF